MSGTAEPVPEQIMTDQPGEHLRALTFAIAENARDDPFRVIVKDRLRYAAEVRERADVPLAPGFARLSWKGLHEGVVAIRQAHDEHRRLPGDAANDDLRLAEIDLRMAGRMGERQKGLLHARARRPHIVFHRGVAAVEAVLGFQPLINPLRRLSLLSRRAQILLQDGVDDRREWPHFRSPHRLRATISRRRGMAANLVNRLSVDAEPAGRFPLRHPVRHHCKADTLIDLHAIHSPGPLRCSKARRLAAFGPSLRRPKIRRRGGISHRRSQFTI